MCCHISNSRILLLVSHISYDPDHMVPVEFHAYAPRISKPRFVQSSHCIIEETKAQLVDSLSKVESDKYQKLGLGLLTQGCGGFSSVHIKSQHNGKTKNITSGVQQTWVQNLVFATFLLDDLGMQPNLSEHQLTHL